MGAPGINGQRGGSEGEGGFSPLFHPFLASLTNLSDDVRDVGGKLGSTLKIVFWVARAPALLKRKRRIFERNDSLEHILSNVPRFNWILPSFQPQL